MAPTVIRDLSDTSGYWAAIWTMCPMPDVHVICDAPVGCFNLVGTAVPDYTDAVPHIENLTPATMTEQEVGGKGTADKVKWTYDNLALTGALDNKHVIVVSTAESEMIGSDHSSLVKQLGVGTKFYYSNSLAEDEWAGRDRVLIWLWDEYGAQQRASVARNPRSVNIIGPTYGCFNAPSELEEMKRMIEGAGGTVNVIFPYATTLADMHQLAAADVTVVLYKEFGMGLAEQLGKPILTTPYGMKDSNAFVRALGALLGTSVQAEAFIAQEKKTTLQAVWDLWRGPQGDWFSTLDVGIVAGQGLAEGLERFLGEELGMKIAFSTARPRRPGDYDNEATRQHIHKKAPSFLFGSMNERIYLREAGSRFTNYIPASFPGPAVRRAVGTPYIGYRGCVILMQEIVNRLYDGLLNFLPVDSAYAAARSNAGSGGPPAAAPSGQSGNLRWSNEAREMLDAELQKLPYLPRISASRQLQMAIEEISRQRGATEVTAELVTAGLAANRG
jgi:chlorophyllide a reductase subunit Z